MLRRDADVFTDLVAELYPLGDELTRSAAVPIYSSMRSVMDGVFLPAGLLNLGGLHIDNCSAAVVPLYQLLDLRPLARLAVSTGYVEQTIGSYFNTRQGQYPPPNRVELLQGFYAAAQQDARLLREMSKALEPLRTLQVLGFHLNQHGSTIIMGSPVDKLRAMLDALVVEPHESWTVAAYDAFNEMEYNQLGEPQRPMLGTSPHSSTILAYYRQRKLRALLE